MNRLCVFTRIIRCGLWIVLPLLFTSYISPKTVWAAADPEAGNYILQVTGSSNLELNGNILYSTAIETTASGRKYTLMELRLDNRQLSEAHSLGFLISRPGSSVELSTGTYKISMNGTGGYFPNFDGAFGFANIDSAGELPFFAMEGTIKISRRDLNNMEGSLEMTFRNENSENLKIKGKFKAINRLVQ